MSLYVTYNMSLIKLYFGNISQCLTIFLLLDLAQFVFEFRGLLKLIFLLILDSRLDQVSSYNDADFDRLTCKV